MCKRKLKKKKKKLKKLNQYGMCKRNSQMKKREKKPTTGCVRETPFRKVNPTWDV